MPTSVLQVVKPAEPAFLCGWVPIPKTGSNSIRKALKENHQLRRIEPQDLPAGAWTFAMVREPLARLISCWRSRHEVGDLSWPEFVGLVASQSDEECDYHWKPQATLLEGVRVDYTGRIEEPEDWHAVCRRIGGVCSHLTRENVSQRDMPSVTREQMQIVQRRYRRDYLLLGY